MPKLSPKALRRLLSHHFDVSLARSNDLEIAITCQEPGCGDRTANCSISTKWPHLYHCWRCNAGGRLATLFRKHGIDFEADETEDLQDLAPLSELDEVLNISTPPIHQALTVELPKGARRLVDNLTSGYARLIGLMAKRKKLDLMSFVEAKVHYVTEGRWEPYAIFPVYELGRLVYYQGRSYSAAREKSGESTKLFPSKAVVPLGSSHWLYNYDNAAKAGVHTILVVESILNCLSLRSELSKQNIYGVEPVAVFKHAISPVQLRKLMAMQATELCLAFDGDATASAMKTAATMVGTKQISIAQMPVGIDANDDAVLAVKQFKARQPYSAWGAIASELDV